MSDLPISCRLPIDPQAAADPNVLSHADHLAQKAVDVKLAEANRVMDGEPTKAWVIARHVEGEITESPWAPGEPTHDALFIYLDFRANTVPA